MTHYLLRNLVAAKPPIDPEIDALMDSATPEPLRGEIASLERLSVYRPFSLNR